MHFCDVSFPSPFPNLRIIDDLWYRDISDVEPAYIDDFEQVSPFLAFMSGKKPFKSWPRASLALVSSSFLSVCKGVEKIFSFAPS